MGVNRHTYVGPYLRITVKAETVRKKVKQCLNNHVNGFHAPKFCPECGAAIEEVEVEQEYLPSLYDLLEELNDDFFPASEKGTVIVALPNHTHEWVESEDDGNGGWAVKLADTRIPDQCIAALHLKYLKTLEGLKAHKSTKALEVTFGVVTYWM